MSAGKGAKWGALVGLLYGLVVDAIISTQESYIRQLAYEAIQEALVQHGVEITPSELEIPVTATIITIYLAIVVGAIIFMTIAGAIIGALWRKLKLPWYTKGVIFGLALVAISAVLSVISPGDAAYISWLSYAQWALDFASAVAIAYLIERSARKAK